MHRNVGCSRWIGTDLGSNSLLAKKIETLVAMAPRLRTNRILFKEFRGFKGN